MKNFSIALGKEKSKINLWRRQKPKNSYTNFLPSKGFHQSSFLLIKINDSRSNILFNFVKHYLTIGMMTFQAFNQHLNLIIKLEILIIR